VADGTLKGASQTELIASAVTALMPELKADLARLVAIPSISAPNFPKATRPSLLEAYEAVTELFRAAGARIVDPLELPDTAPVVMGERSRPRGLGLDLFASRPA
jgi:hypothetical protein